MANQNITTAIVFLQGLASFASPCVLPLLPVYLSYLAGASLEEIEASKKLQRSMVFHAIGFMMGLSLVFVALGATASALGRFLYVNAEIFRKASGIIVILFGLHHGKIIHIKFLDYEKRATWQDTKPRFFNAFLLGVTFSFGWTPCVGPILASVLMMASSMQTVGLGMRLLAIYSLGLSIPFVMAALTLNIFLNYFRGIFKHFHRIKVVSGLLLVIMGILIYTNYLYRLSFILSY